ncbi:branched-chain amino acid ABC transporter permease [Mesorhizobium sp. DCY119]|uniref:branched-chain amino acid ABC transporter permease n=1 Tax=Mesorhizobium sp. DCY119 TaxID=2108445 RepID=UPI001FE081E7|nr:branched-chain amino acid ABC transporter permease [Mesorhizobium sp. DCY119]
MPIIVLALLALLIQNFAEPYQVRIAYAFMLNLTLALGIQVFMGNSGVLSFGHVSFMGVASYAVSILTIPVAIKATLIPTAPFGLAALQLPMPAAVLIALLLVAVLAWLSGYLVVRVSGAAAEILTLALLVIAYVVFTGWIDLTRGQRSLYGIPVVSSLPVAAAVAALAIFVAKMFRDSNPGLQLRASSEDMLAARAAGVHVARLRHVAWVLSAIIAAAAGILHATFMGVIGPNNFYFSQTFLIIAMIILGGSRSVSGVIVGTFLVSAGNELARTLENGPTVLGVELPQMFGLTGFFLGFVIVLTMTWKRNGLMGDREFEDLIKIGRIRNTKRVISRDINSDVAPQP